MLNQYKYELYRRKLQTVALIDYERRPYVSKYDPDFRLTFDHHLSARKTLGIFPYGGENAKIIKSGYTIMEVKFRHHMPSWFHRIIQSYELRRISISKICEGTKTLDIAEELA